MKRLMFLLVLLVGVVGAMGSATAGQGIGVPTVRAMGAVSPMAAHAPSVIGTWVIVHKTQDGLDIACKTGESWPVGTVRQVVVLGSTGSVTETFYSASLTPLKTLTGTWSTSGLTTAGKITLTVGGKTTSNAGYSVSLNVLTITPPLSGGHTFVWQWAKERQPSGAAVSLIGHDASLVKTWKAIGVWVNGVSKPLSYLTGGTPFDPPSFARSFLANGKSQRYLLTGANVRLPQPALQNWATGGGLIKYLPGSYQSAIYKLAGVTLTIWQLDALGNTLKVCFTPYGAAGAHDARVVGTWDVVSAIAATPFGAVDVLPTLLSQQPGATLAKATFRPDGTGEGQLYSGTTLSSAALSTWNTTTSPTMLHFVALGLSLEGYVIASPPSRPSPR